MGKATNAGNRPCRARTCALFTRSKRTDWSQAKSQLRNSLNFAAQQRTHLHTRKTTCLAKQCLETSSRKADCGDTVALACRHSVLCGAHVDAQTLFAKIREEKATKRAQENAEASAAAREINSEDLLDRAGVAAAVVSGDSCAAAGVVSDDCLGECSAGVPLAAHELAVGLFKEGKIGTTTSDQRARHSNGTHKVPRFWEPLQKHGYISQNYGWEPMGFKWRESRHGWSLIGI